MLCSKQSKPSWSPRKEKTSAIPTQEPQSFVLADSLGAGGLTAPHDIAYSKTEANFAVNDIKDHHHPQRLQSKDCASTVSSSCSTSCNVAALTDSMEEKVVTSSHAALPRPQGPGCYRHLRWALFTTYHRLFSIVFCGNLVAMVLVLRRIIVNPHQVDGDTRPDLAHVLTAVSANLTASIAIRNEHIINMLFRIFVTNTSIKLSLGIRRHFAKVYQFGGVHSGGGVAAVIWYGIYTFVSVHDFVQSGRPRDGIASTVLTIMIWTLMVALLTAAYPRIRAKMHDWFEISHRFFGWSILLLFWAQTLTFCIIDSHSRGVDPAAAMLRLPTFWTLMVMTLTVIYPWLRIKRVKVRYEALSQHAIRMHVLPGKGKPMQPCRVVAISHSPLRETHKFATIPERDGASGYSMVVSRAGDWTSKIIDNPPQSIWIKGMPAWGVIRVAAMFDPVVIIATGSGIGPCLGLFSGFPKLPCRVAWQAKTPLKTYGKGICDAVRLADQNALIIDSTEAGRQDMARLALMLYQESKAEAVIVISNTKGTYHVVRDLESRGIPAYGPIWDS